VTALSYSQWLLAAVLACSPLAQVGGFASAHAASSSATASATIIAPVAIGTSDPQVSPVPGRPMPIVIQSTGGLSGSGSSGGSAGGSVTGSGGAASDAEATPNGYTITIEGDKTYAITMPPPILAGAAGAGVSIGADMDGVRTNGSGLLSPPTQTVLIAGTLMASLSHAQGGEAGSFGVVIEYN
jgi:hypothetical protein